MNITAQITPDETNPRINTFTMTKEVCDRDGEVVLLDGIRWKNYEKNPVVMFDHGKDRKVGKIPVGKTLSAQRVGDSFEARTELAERPDNHPVNAEWIPDTLAALVKQKCLNCVSIGFLEVAKRKATAQDRAKYGANTRVIHTEVDLFEISMTGTPVNADALVTARGKGLLPDSSDAYAPAESEKPVKNPVKVPVSLKSMRHIVPVEIDQKSRIAEIVRVRVKGGLYA
jgi:hypothetical protein